MKARKLISASAVALMAFAFALPATAAVVGGTPPTTNGDVTFTGADENTEGGKPTTPKDDNDGEGIVPGPGESNHTDGPLRIEHVPTLHFGSQVVSTKDMSYNSLWNTGTVGGATTSTNIPVFAQVRDETAAQTNDWTLSVVQSTPFAPSTAGSTSPNLTNTRVHIYAATAYNSLRGTTGSIATLTPVTINTTAGYTEIPYSQTGTGLVIMTGENTNGSDSSLVFSDTTQYEPSTGNYSVTGADNAGLKLFVPGTDVAYAEAYEATFTWTLDNTL